MAPEVAAAAGVALVELGVEAEPFADRRDVLGEGLGPADEVDLPVAVAQVVELGPPQPIEPLACPP